MSDRNSASETVPAGEGAAEVERPPRGPLALALRRLLRKKIAVAALVFIGVFYFCGLFAPVVAPRSYTDQNLDAVQQGPSLTHPLGTDALGRDMLSRVIWASRTTVVVTVATLMMGGLVLAVGLGLLAGYAGGKVDTAIMRVGDVFFGLPGLPMLIMINATVGERVRSMGWLGAIEKGLRIDGFPDYVVVFGALSLFAWVGGARIIRSQVLALRETEYLTAARAMGASTWRIIGRHLLPNVSNIVIVSLSASLGAIAGTEIMLSWFGVGVQPPTPSFGAMLYEGGSIRTLQAHPHLLLAPGAIIAGLIFSFNLLGDALTDVLTPHAR
ncbi:MAG TPA: ABC transporter permease [Dehalococcoidia bacterium]|nr:ABC transporter permease [Thermoleophilia bacterium]HUS82239.1 ABC transporter permease [Dehalococcoidia bacterium]